MKSPASQLALSLDRPIPPTRPQGKKCLAMLQAAREHGVSGVTFTMNYLFAYSQECTRLKARGYEIVSKRDGDSPVHRYFLAEFYRP